MPSAIAFAVIAMLAWGLWAVLADVATRTISPTAAMVVSYAVSIVVAVGYVAVDGSAVDLTGEGVWIAAVAGVFAGIGAVAFYTGLAEGRTAIVTTVSAMYFVVAAVLGIVVLREAVSATDLAGIGCAVLAVALLAR